MTAIDWRAGRWWFLGMSWCSFGGRCSTFNSVYHFVVKDLTSTNDTTFDCWTYHLTVIHSPLHWKTNQITLLLRITSSQIVNTLAGSCSISSWSFIQIGCFYWKVGMNYSAISMGIFHELTLFWFLRNCTIPALFWFCRSELQGSIFCDHRSAEFFRLPENILLIHATEEFVKVPILTNSNRSSRFTYRYIASWNNYWNNGYTEHSSTDIFSFSPSAHTAVKWAYQWTEQCLLASCESIVNMTITLVLRREIIITIFYEFSMWWLPFPKHTR